MRIVAGSARGRTLKTPRRADVTRPTADRVRETLFNVLGQWMDGFTVLDLYAGTGALGLEAVSRGAERAVLVDSSREAAALCRENASALGFASRVEVHEVPVARALERLVRDGARFDLVFADPPYAAQVGAWLLERVPGVLGAGGRLCFEHDRREGLPESPEGWTQVTQRRFGDTCFSVYVLA